MKPNKKNKTVLNAEGKFSRSSHSAFLPEDYDGLSLDQLGTLVIRLLNDKKLEVSKVRPFYWSLVEAYVDRFHRYPFDADKALFSHLELNDYPEESVLRLIQQLESQYAQRHDSPLRQATASLSQNDASDDEVNNLKGSLKYAAMVAEADD